MWAAVPVALQPRAGDADLAAGVGEAEHGQHAEALPRVQVVAAFERRTVDRVEEIHGDRMDAQIAETFTTSKAAFDRDELVERGRDLVAVGLQGLHVRYDCYAACRCFW